MKRYFGLLFLLLLFIFLPKNYVFGQDSRSGVAEPRIAPPIRIQPNVNIFGQEHSYTVTFRGNGEAIVFLKAILANTSDEPLTDISLRIPRVKPEDIGVYQVLRERDCVSYGSPEPIPLRGAQINPVETQSCTQYREPDFFQGWGVQTYQKADFEFSGDTIKITLPQPIGANLSGSYILMYSAFGYAKKNVFGAYDFNFQTAQIEDKIYNLQVGINTDSDLLLRGGQAYVDYRFDTSTIANLKSVEGSQAVSSPAFDNYYQQIGYGQINKSASNLKPLESYEVNGSFGDSWIRVFAYDIVMVLVILVFILIVLVVIGRYLYRRFSRPAEKTTEEHKLPMILEVLGIGFISSLIIVVYSVVVYFANILLMDSSLYFGGYFEPLFMLLSLVVSVGVYAALFLGPSIYIYTKKGLGWAQVQFVVIVLFVMMYLLIFAIFSLIYRNPEMYKIRPLPEPAQLEIQPDEGNSSDSVSP